jgi:hypothetical protein
MVMEIMIIINNIKKRNIKRNLNGLSRNINLDKASSEDPAFERSNFTSSKLIG